jgi:GNAT superfamily N-acetyltransferase
LTESLLKIEPINHDQAIPFELLTLADPSLSQIKKYLDAGQCYVAKIDSQLIGVLVLTELTPTTIEIKNIAILEFMQGKGYGKQLLKFAEEIARKSNYQKLIIGTGNSSIGQLALYQKEGFEITSVVKDFFVTNYKEPIFENGIQCKHMIMLEKELHESGLIT